MEHFYHPLRLGRPGRPGRQVAAGERAYEAWREGVQRPFREYAAVPESSVFEQLARGCEPSLARAHVK
jgi:hypothetical protein